MSCRAVQLAHSPSQDRHQTSVLTLVAVAGQHGQQLLHGGGVGVAEDGLVVEVGGVLQLGDDANGAVLGQDQLQGEGWEWGW